MKIALATEPNGNVKSATFSITDPKGKVSKHPFAFPSNALCALYGFQVDLVGPGSGTHTCIFTSGTGTLTYSVSSGKLAVQNTNTCGGSQFGTAETSNAVYGDVTPASGSTISQSLGRLNWSAQVELTDRATATGPALALNNGVLCMAWQGVGQNNIWVAVSRDKGATGSSQKELTIARRWTRRRWRLSKASSLWPGAGSSRTISGCPIQPTERVGPRKSNSRIAPATTGQR
jgi:hypothetical protein